MTDEEQKVWEELVKNAEDDIVASCADEYATAILAADAELKRLREVVDEQ